jgi:hypothetical protein
LEEGSGRGEEWKKGRMGKEISPNLPTFQSFPFIPPSK